MQNADYLTMLRRSKWSKDRVAVAWADGAVATGAKGTLATDGREVTSYGWHKIATTTPEGEKIAYDCRYSLTTVQQTLPFKVIADRVDACPQCQTHAPKPPTGKGTGMVVTPAGSAAPPAPLQGEVFGLGVTVGYELPATWPDGYLDRVQREIERLPGFKKWDTEGALLPLINGIYPAQFEGISEERARERLAAAVQRAQRRSPASAFVPARAQAFRFESVSSA